MNGKRNSLWSRDELILALDVYFKVDAYKITDNSTEVILLSESLRVINESLTSKPGFNRTQTSVRMKLQNFLRLDPDQAYHSLPHGSKLEKQIWDEFSCDHAHLHLVVMSMIEECRRPLENFALQDKEIASWWQK